VGNPLRDSEDARLKKITVANYRRDPYYAAIVRVVDDLLLEKGFVAPVELFIRMDLLSPESAENWRRGRISYLERVIRCNLSKASRILRILRMLGNYACPCRRRKKLQCCCIHDGHMWSVA